MYFVEIEILPGSTIQPLHDPYSRTNVLVKGNITQVLNAVNDFKFDLLPSHPLYEADIRSYVSLVRVRDHTDEIIFRGRIVDYSRKMAGDGQMVKSYVAECELAYLLDSIQEAEELVNITIDEYFKRLLSVHNRRVGDDDKRINTMSILGIHSSVPISFDRNCLCGTTTDVYHINYMSTYQNIKTHILDVLGGYVWLDYPNGQRRLNYAETSGELREMPIELAVNLENMTSSYQASQDYTRLIPLGAELERYELAIDRLKEIGVIQGESDFWLNEVRHHRDGISLIGQEAISPWSGQLLLGLSKLNYKHRCTCPDECQSDTCSRCNIAQLRQRIESERMPADINSRYYYNEAVDWLCNSGLIGSSEHWKEEDKVSNIHVRWLIRLAAMAISPESPRRGNHNSTDSALYWLGGDSGWFGGSNWFDRFRPVPPPPHPCKCEDCECEPCDCCDCEPCDCCDCEPCDCCECEEETCCPNCCDCCDCEPCDCCDCEPCDCCDCDSCDDDDCENSSDVARPAMEKLLPLDDSQESESPWMGQLLINLSRLNFSRRDDAEIEAFEAEIEESIDDMDEYYKAIDSLSNTGVILSPNYWKQEELSEDEELRKLIRLSDKMADHEYPIMMNPSDAITWLKEEYGFFTAEEEAFWRDQIREPSEGAEDHRLSEWISELLIKLSLVNYERSIEGLRELLAPKPIAPIDDFGAYNEALDSLSNAGAIQSPDYWKEPARRYDINLRWLIRLADLAVDHDDPQSDFPRPRLTIKAGANDNDWLPIKEGANVPIIEGVVIFDTNDPEELRRKAKRWIAEHQTVTNSVSISAVDLSHLDHVTYEDFRVGDRYQVINPLLGIHEDGEGYPLIQKKIDVVNPIKSGLTFGDRQLMMSSSR